MKLRNLLKKTIFSLIFISTAAVFDVTAANSNIDYFTLARTGSAEDIQNQLKVSSKFTKDTYGFYRQTFLMLLLKYDRPAEVISLVIPYSDLNAADTNGTTPLMTASRYASSSDVIELLLAPGKNDKKKAEYITKADKHNKNSFDYSVLNPETGIYNILIKYADDDRAEVRSEERNDNKPLYNQILQTKNSISKKTVSASAAGNGGKTQVTASKDKTPLTVDQFAEESAPRVSSAGKQGSTSKSAVTSYVPPAAKTASDVNKQDAADSVPAVQPEGKDDASAEKVESAPAVTVAADAEKPEESVEAKAVSPAAVNADTAAPDEQIKSSETTDYTPAPADIRPYTSLSLYDFAITGNPEENETAPADKGLISDPDRKRAGGITPLMAACRDGNDWEVETLLKSGADINARDDEGWSALMYAVRFQNNLGLVKTLISNGAHVRVRNIYNNTPLLMAAEYTKNPEILALLLKNRSNTEDEVFKAFILSITGKEGADYVQLRKIQIFLDMNMPVNRMWKGKTPLMYACQFGGSTQIIDALLQAGAKVNTTDENGMTAFDYAKSNTSLVHDDIFWSLNK